MEHIRLSTTLFATPEEVYDAWLSSLGHTAMTGATATSEPAVGAAHTAWDNYVSGKHLELDPGKRILQTWRTIEFAESDPDSMVEILLVAVPQGTRLTLIQSGIPDGQGEMYTEGWHERYFVPMSRHFDREPPVPTEPAPAPASVPPKAKAPKKVAKKAAKKVAKAKPAKKAAKKVAKKSAKKSAKKVAKRAAKKSAKKAAKKVAKAKPAKKKAKKRR